MRPVAARAGARDIAEGLFCKLLFGHDLTGMFGIDAQTYRSLIHRQNNVVTIGVEEFLADPSNRRYRRSGQLQEYDHAQY